MQVRIVGNRNDADPGLVGARFAELGLGFERCEREYPREWKSLAGVDVLLLLGSEWSVYWEGNAKEVAAEIDLVRTAIQRGVPIFAICFGAQLVSSALGGSVTRSSVPEVGWHEVSSTLHPELLQGSWFQWHYDVFTVPQGMTAVAGNDVGPQAMLGKRILATQFHPEITPEIVTRWSSGLGLQELDRLGIDGKHLCEITPDWVAKRAPATTRLVDWFLKHSATDYR